MRCGVYHSRRNDFETAEGFRCVAIIKVKTAQTAAKPHNLATLALHLLYCASGSGVSSVLCWIFFTVGSRRNMICESDKLSSFQDGGRRGRRC